MNLRSRSEAAGYGPHDETRPAGSIAAQKYILGVMRMGRFEKAHGKQNEVGLNDFLVAVEPHDGPAAVRIRFPYDPFHFHTFHLVLADETVRIQKPAARTSFLMR